MSLAPTSENWVFSEGKVYIPKDLAACTYYACRFLALKLPASSETIKKIMDSKYRGRSLTVAEIIPYFRDFFHLYRQVPYMIDKRAIDYFGCAKIS